MLQIRDKKAYRKHIETMNPINAKSVQLVELHAFAYCLLFVYLSESFDFLKVYFQFRISLEIPKGKATNLIEIRPIIIQF